MRSGAKARIKCERKNAKFTLKAMEVPPLQQSVPQPSPRVMLINACNHHHHLHS